MISDLCLCQTTAKPLEQKKEPNKTSRIEGFLIGCLFRIIFSGTYPLSSNIVHCSAVWDSELVDFVSFWLRERRDCADLTPTGPLFWFGTGIKM